MMRSCRSTFHLALATLGLLLLAARVASAQPGTESFSANYFAELRGEDEVNAVNDNARGLFLARVNIANKTLRYRLSVGGLDSITAAHIHRGPYGQDGPPVFPLPGLTDSTMTITGTWTMSQGAVDSLLAGFLYINVHTAAHPNGHIRAQIIPLPNALTPGITASQEGHAVTDSSGSGDAYIHIDQATKVLYYYLRWRDLTGPATAAHFHLGVITTDGLPLKTIDLTPNQNYASGSWQLDDTTYDDFLSAQLYVNIHTAQNPEGEIRGQILPAHVFTAALDPANSVPPHRDSSVGAGTGFAIIGLSPFANVLGARAIVGGTTSVIDNAHIHVAPIGQEGLVYQPLLPLPNSPYYGIPDGVARFVTDDTVSIFLSNGAYMNFHTARFPRGEIRGQLIPAATNLVLTTTSAPVAPVQNGSFSATYFPATDEIVLRTAQVTLRTTVRVYSAMGAQIATAAIDGYIVRINAHDLPSGTYIARVDGVGDGMVMVVR